MIKRLIGIITFFALSLFLIMPVYSAEPDPFEKTIDVYPGDLDYRNSLVDWNGYNLDLTIYWTKQGGLPPDSARIIVYENNVEVINIGTWIYNSDIDMYYLSMSNTTKNTILRVIYSRTVNIQNYVRILARTTDTDAFLFETRLTFKSLMNINLGSIYIADMLYQSNSGLISGYQSNIDIIGIENVIGGGQAEFTMARLVLETESTRPIATEGVALTKQYANYNFITKYTNVHALNFNLVISANSYDPSTANVSYFIYQLGFFADSQVILPELDIDTDFQIYVPTICGILDLACISRNLIGELSNTVYNRLGADSIASGIMAIYDTIFYPVYIIDNSAYQNAILSIYGMLVIGLLIIIIKRVT
jgi:hypothetical protein